jgi:hypothetical protein
MTREGMTPLTALTTARLEALEGLVTTYAAIENSDGLHSAAHAIAELIDIRQQITKIAAACPDKATARALIKL